MTQNPPCSSGCTSSSTPPAAADASTTPAAPPLAPHAEGWERRGYGEIGRGPYRIARAYVARPQQALAPVFHAFHRFAFLGTFPGADEAKAFCHDHQERAA